MFLKKTLKYNYSYNTPILSLFFFNNTVIRSLSTLSPYCYIYRVKYNIWESCATQLLLSTSNYLTYLLDGLLYKVTYIDYFCQFNWNCMLADFQVVFQIKVRDLTPIIRSIANIYKSASWLERELAELSGFIFLNTIDSRRLLTDYVETKETPTTHTFEWRDFSNIYGEIEFSTWIWVSDEYLD